MRLLILVLLSIAPLFGGQSLQLTTGNTLSFTPPNEVPWTALGAARVEIALDLNTCSGETTFFKLGNWRLRCSSATNVSYGTDVDDGSLGIAGKTQMLIRMQRDPSQTLASSNGTAPVAHLEIWANDGTGRVSRATNDAASAMDVSSIQSYAVGTSDIEFHWIKVYSTLTEVGANAPVPDPHGVGDLANWDFEGVLTDSGPDSMTFSASGTGFTTTPTFNPVADPTVDADPFWMQAPSVRAGAEITLSAERSISHDDVDGLTCVWSDQTGGSGPTAILFTGSTTACTTTAVFPTFGDFDLRLVVTDNSAGTGTANVTVGAVATDSNRIVVMDNDSFAFTLGEHIQWGQSAWPFLPERTYKMAETFAANRSAASWRTFDTGTVTVSNGSPTVEGAGGTDFANLICSGGTTPDGGAGGPNKLVIRDSGGVYWVNNIAACVDADTLTLSANWNKTGEGGLSYSYWTEAENSLWINGSENENYYDNVWAYYTLCKTSGLQWACTDAAELAALWWEMPFIANGMAMTGPSGGSLIMQPRLNALIGIMLWAKEQGTEASIFPGIEDYIEFFDFLRIVHSLNYCAGDPREAWYVGMWLSLAMELDPDATRVSNYQSILTAAMDASAGASGGDIDPDICRHPSGVWHGYDATAGASTVSVTNGSNEFVCASSGACSWDAGDVGSWVQIGVLNDRDHVTDVGQYQITAQDADKLTVTPNFAGTTGSGRWYFIKAVNTYTFQALTNAMPNIALDWQYRHGFSDRRDVIVEGTDGIVVNNYRAPLRGLYVLNDDNAGCSASIAAETVNSANNCQFDPAQTASSQRFLIAEIAGAMALGVKYGRQIDDANTASRIAQLDDMMGATFGALGGPDSDTDWASEYNDSGATFTQGGNGKQKNFGFCCGVGQSSAWDAERLGGLAAEDLVSYSVPLDIGSVAMATKASVTLYEPRGFSRVVNDQTGSTASVIGDARQGDHLAKIEYKDAMDSVLQTDFVMVETAGEGASESAVEIGGAATVTGSLTVQ
jgi:hypothetical protein